MKNAMTTVCDVGRFYLVPCMFVERDARASWIPRDGWLPVLGPKHEDAEHLEFPWPHYHVDWRFVSERSVAVLIDLSRQLHGRVLTNNGGNALTGKPELKRRMCRRQMPDHPPIRSVAFGIAASRGPENWRRLEGAHRCSRLKPGNVCPHRGIDLTPFAKPDGTAICPGHGLRWDLRTGEMLPHHAREARECPTPSNAAA